MQQQNLSFKVSYVWLTDITLYPCILPWQQPQQQPASTAHETLQEQLLHQLVQQIAACHSVLE